MDITVCSVKIHILHLIVHFKQSKHKFQLRKYQSGHIQMIKHYKAHATSGHVKIVCCVVVSTWLLQQHQQHTANGAIFLCFLGNLPKDICHLTSSPLTETREQRSRLRKLRLLLIFRSFVTSGGEQVDDLLRGTDLQFICMFSSKKMTCHRATPYLQYQILV